MASFDYPAQICLTPVVDPVQASVRLPGSKSITNRALLLAALAEGQSRLRSPLHSEDTLVMAQALRELGIKVDETPEQDLLVTGGGGAFVAPDKALFVGNSGTTVRFLTAATCLTPLDTDVVLDGVARMRERPIRDLLGALLSLGVRAESINGGGCPPVRVGGGGLPGGRCRLRGDVSSQYLSALLQVSPYAQSDVEIILVGDLISKPYVDITQSVMRAFGVEMENDDFRVLRVRAGQRYQAQDFTVEADASNASYFLAAAAVTGGTVTLENLGMDSIQGDVRFVDVLAQMGCQVRSQAGQITVTGPERLTAIQINMEVMPDMAQTLAVVAAFANGPSHISGLSSLRVKETDRLQAVAKELPKLGVGIEEGRDFWTIVPPPEGRLQGATIATYDDHRMAMAFAVAGLRIPGVVIDDPGCVVKTFPDFWQRWQGAFGAAL